MLLKIIKGQLVDFFKISGLKNSIFARLLAGTFKVLKTKLQQEGFDPRRTSDKIYYFDSRLSKYHLTTDEKYSCITCGNIKI